MRLRDGVILALFGAVLGGIIAYTTRPSVPAQPVKLPEPVRAGPVLNKIESLSLGADLTVYAVKVDAKPFPFICIIMSGPGAATMHCDSDVSVSPSAAR